MTNYILNTILGRILSLKVFHSYHRESCLSMTYMILHVMLMEYNELHCL